MAVNTDNFGFKKPDESDFTMSRIRTVTGILQTRN